MIEQTEVVRPRTDAPARAVEAPPTFGRVLALDGLRGLAVALVVVYHFAPHVLPAGFLGVDLFFVLSGFLITSLALGEHSSTSTLSVRSFYVRRARRLLPAAITAVVLIVVIAAVVQPDSTRGTTRGQGIASLLYGANWWSIVQDDSYQAAFGSESPLSHFWSLAVEEQFYLVFPILLLGGMALLRRRRGATTRPLAIGLLVVSLVGAVASATLMAALHDPGQDPSRLYFGTDTRIQALLLGVAGACVWWLWSGVLRGPATARVLGVVGAASVAFLVWVAATTELRDAWLYRFGFLVVAAAAMAAILAVCSSRSVLTRAFELRWMCVLGIASYSIYLWHWPIRVFVTADSTPFDDVGLFVVRLALTAVAATASLLLIERPFRHATDRRAVTLASCGALVVAVVAVWVVARPTPAPATEFSSEVAPTVEAPVDAAPAALPPLRVLWLGDSVAWTIGGGHFDYPQPVGFDNPFDPAHMVIWNKADYSCPLVKNPKRSFGVVKVKTGWCVERATEWPKLLDEFPADVVSWSASMFDTYDYQVDDGWLSFASPEWDALYRENLEQARAVATSRGAVFVLLGQADPVADPDEDDQESLLPENIWRWGHVRDLQREFAAAHPDDTRFIDLQPIVCPDDSCAAATLDDPGLRADGVHFWHGTIAPLAPRIQAAFDEAMGRAP